MQKKYLVVAALIASATAFAGIVQAADALLAPGDPSVAIATDKVSKSSYPAAEAPYNVADQNPETKYLNQNNQNTGFIITPSYGASVIKRVQFTSANDSVARDPLTFKIYGTNDAITSVDNGDGGTENWELIAEGECQLPEERLTKGPMITFANNNSYTSYRVLFPTIKNTSADGNTQIGDVQFFETEIEEEGEWGVLSGADFDVLAFQLPTGSLSDYADQDGSVWVTSGSSYLFDGNKSNQYGNKAKKNTGFIVAPISGLTKIESFKLYTGDSEFSFACCDPIDYKLYGTLDPLTSADNSTGDAENWTLIAEGPLNLPVARSTWSDEIFVDNNEFYRCYKMVFSDIRDPNDEKATAMKISELQFYGEKEKSSLGEPIFLPGDVTRQINIRGNFEEEYTNVGSGYPANENPPLAIDGSVDTKYLNNGGGNGAGIIITTSSAKVATAIQGWTANDSEGRDPKTWELYGTNDAIQSQDNSDGLGGENWTLIASGDDFQLPATRKTAGGIITFENTSAYKSYKIMFPKNKGEALMQIGDLQLYTDAEGTNGIFTPSDTAIAVRYDHGFAALYANIDNNEGPQKVVDGLATSKNCCNTGAGTGYIITPKNSLSIAKAIYIITGNDAPERDPMTFEVYGTNEEIKSGDFSIGDAESWTKIAEGELGTPEGRGAKSEPVAFENEQSFRSYKIIFPTLRNSDRAYQVAEVQLMGFILEYAPTNLINSDDKYLAVSATLRQSSSYYNGNPADEGPYMAIDGDKANTKYLNQGTEVYANLGMIYIPADQVKRSLTSMTITTANDAPERDPASYILYGTDDEVTSADNSGGTDENWTKVAEGEFALPEARLTDLPQIAFLPDYAPTPAFKNWKIVFPTRRNGGKTVTMQFEEIEFFDENWDNSWMQPGVDRAIAVGDIINMGSYPDQEGPKATADGLITVKYLNYGANNSGFIVTKAGEPIVVNAIRYTSANDFPSRSPLSYAIFGTNEEIKSQDKSVGDAEEWTLISEGAFEGLGVGVAVHRDTDAMYFANDVAYKSYKVLFTEVGNPNEYMQIGECYLYNIDDPVPPGPTEMVLNYAVEDDNLVLSWSASYGDAALEVADSINGAWTALPPAELVGGAFQVVVPMSEVSKGSFYRLSK